MPPELKAARIIAKSTAVFIECQSMIAANQERESKGLSQAYNEQAFYELSRSLRILIERATQ